MKDTIKIKYDTSVFTPAGWRSVTVTANAEKTSPKRCVIVDVIDIDGNGNVGYASRTGANRQKYNVSYAASNEIGKKKNISSIEVLD